MGPARAAGEHRGGVAGKVFTPGRRKVRWSALRPTSQCGRSCRRERSFSPPAVRWRCRPLRCVLAICAGVGQMPMKYESMPPPVPGESKILPLAAPCCAGTPAAGPLKEGLAFNSAFPAARFSRTHGGRKAAVKIKERSAAGEGRLGRARACAWRALSRLARG